MENPKICCVCETAGSAHRCACKAVFYCGPECQQADWSKHQKVCTEHLLNQLKKKRKEHGKDDKRVGEANFDLGLIQERQERYPEAEKMFKEAHRIYTLVYGVSHREVAKTGAHLGNVYRCMGQFTRALEMQKDALRISRSVIGDRTPEVALMLGNIAANYLEQGKVKEALELFLEEYNITCETGGREQLTVVRCLHNLSSIYMMLGELDKSLESCEEAIGITRSTAVFDDANHECLAHLLFQTGNVFRERSLHQDARAKYEEALVLFRRLHGEKHPIVTTILWSIANTHAFEGHFDEALKLYKKCVKIRRRNDEHEHMAMSMSGIASVYFKQGKYEEALEKYEEALLVLIRGVGPDHRTMATWRYKVALCKDKLGDKEGALENLKEAHRICAKLGLYEDGTAQKAAK
jgi:tetratricopeptide (TPR) repeat protein